MDPRTQRQAAALERAEQRVHILIEENARLLQRVTELEAAAQQNAILAADARSAVAANAEVLRLTGETQQLHRREWRGG